MPSGERFEYVSPSLDAKVVELLRIAVRSLATEDVAFNKAFSTARQQDHAFYEQANHGLAYWVFETQLIYTIFKSWIPFTRVMWEGHAYSESPRRSADLAVFPDQTGSSTNPSMVFEAKWWNRKFERSVKQREALDHDIQKLLGVPATIGRFEIAFWWDIETDLTSSKDEVSRYCVEASGQSGSEVRMVFLDAFPTRFRSVRNGPPVKDGLFVMAVLRVEPVSQLGRLS